MADDDARAALTAQLASLTGGYNAEHLSAIAEAFSDPAVSKALARAEAASDKLVLLAGSRTSRVAQSVRAVRQAATLLARADTLGQG